MSCGIDSLGDCPGDIASDIIGGAANQAWEAMAKSWAKDATDMVGTFAKYFANIANPVLDTGPVADLYKISIGIAFTIAAMLLMLQTGRAVITQSGSGLMSGLIGIGKAVVAIAATTAVAVAALLASDEIASLIVAKTTGSTEGLEKKLTTVLVFGGPGAGPGVTLFMAIVGIALLSMLWIELLLRNAAIAVLIATSPIAAVGMISESTRGWWSKLVSATIQLIILKPVIALVFGLGIMMVGDQPVDKPIDLQMLLQGIVILLLAAIAWPAIARFMPFTNVQGGAGFGLGTALGFAGGRMSGGGGGGGPVGVNPADFAAASEAQTTASAAGSGAGAGAGAGAGGGAAAGGAAAGGAAAAGAIAAPLLIAAAGIQMAQRAANSMTGAMERTAGHAGMDNRMPYTPPAGHPGPQPSTQAASAQQTAIRDGHQPPPPPPPEPAPPVSPIHEEGPR